MKKLLASLLISGVAIFVGDYLLESVSTQGWETYLILVIVFGVLNTFIKPLVQILTLPITVITLGLFALVINAVFVLLADFIVPGFEVDGFLAALIFGIIFSLVSAFLKLFD